MISLLVSALLPLSSCIEELTDLAELYCKFNYSNYYNLAGIQQDNEHSWLGLCCSWDDLSQSHS